MSKLDERHEQESQRLLLADGHQSSEGQLLHLQQQTVDNSDRDRLFDCDVSRRRNRNETIMDDEGQVSGRPDISAERLQVLDYGNPYSEILNPTRASPISGRLAKAGYPSENLYRAESSLMPPNLIEEELDQMIESKRKRTLLLLRAKEAPRASIELTSPAEEEPDCLHLLGVEGRARSPAVLSDYENVGDGSSQDELQHDSVLANASTDPDVVDRTDQTDLVGGATQVQQRSSGDQLSFVSPSESQNFNTLSIVSDILGDLSQEESSLVQQLSRG